MADREQARSYRASCILQTPVLLGVSLSVPANASKPDFIQSDYNPQGKSGADQELPGEDLFPEGAPVPQKRRSVTLLALPFFTSPLRISVQLTPTMRALFQVCKGTAL